MPLNIAKAQITDLPELVRLNGVVQDLHARLYPDIFRSDWSYSDLEDFWRTRLNLENTTVAIATLNGRSVGYIWFEVQIREQNAFKLFRRSIYVHHIVVDEDVRGEGIGTLLVEQTELEAKRLSISNVAVDAWASNSTAQEFFGSRGYDHVNIIRSKNLAA